MVRTGQHCLTLMDDLIHDIPAGTFQCDEIWTFVGKKDNRLNGEASAELGSQFIFVAMDADTKLVPSYRIGKRDPELAFGLMMDLRERVIGRPQISTDGFRPYIEAVRQSLGQNVDFAQLVKVVREIGHHPRHR